MHAIDCGDPDYSKRCPVCDPYPHRFQSKHQTNSCWHCDRRMTDPIHIDGEKESYDARLAIELPPTRTERDAMQDSSAGEDGNNSNRV